MSVPGPVPNAWGAGDGEQRPLVPRSRSSPRLTPGVRLRTKSPGKTQHKMHEVATFLTQSSSFLHATGFFHGIHSL